MPSRSWQFRIDDIIEAINKIQQYTRGYDFDSWCKDAKTIDAVIRNIEIIGEASSRLPEEVQKQFEDIPWSTMKAIRNIVVHEYFGVDLEIIWKTVKEDLPDLKKLLLK